MAIQSIWSSTGLAQTPSTNKTGGVTSIWDNFTPAPATTPSPSITPTSTPKLESLPQTQPQKTDIFSTLGKTWNSISSAVGNAFDVFINKISPVVSPLPDKTPTEKLRTVATNVFDRMATSLFPLSEERIQKEKDWLVKNYDSPVTKGLTLIQKFAEEDFKNRPEVYGFTKGITSLAIGGTKSFSDYYNQEQFIPKDLFGQVRMTYGQIAEKIFEMSSGANVLKSVNAVKQLLPVMFATIGQLNAPTETTIKERLLLLPKDLITGWLFTKLPGSEKVLSVQTLKGAIPAGVINYASEVTGKLIEGMDAKEALKTSYAAFIIGSLFHVAGVGYNEFTGAKMFNTEKVMTPQEIFNQTITTKMPDSAKAEFNKIALKAQAEGLNVKFSVSAVKESPAAKVVGKGVVEAVTGKPQEIKLTNGEGTPYYVRVEFVNPNVKLPTSGQSPEVNLQKAISTYVSDEGVYKKPDGTIEQTPSFKELLKVADTPEAKKITQTKVEEAIKSGELTKNDDGSLTVYRVGTIQTDRPISVSYDKKAAESFAEQASVTGTDRKVNEMTIQPEDVKVFIGGTEKELLVKLAQINEPTEGKTNQTWDEMNKQRDAIVVKIGTEKIEPQVEEAVKELNTLGYPTSSSGFLGQDSKLAKENGNVPTHSIDGLLNLSNSQIEEINKSGLGKVVKMDNFMPGYQAILVSGNNDLSVVKEKFNKIIEIIKKISMDKSMIEEANNKKITEQTNLKFEKQKKDGWCGPTALQYALQIQGIDATQTELASDMGATIKEGADPGQIAKTAKKYGLKVEMLEGEDAEKTLTEMDTAIASGKSVIVDFLDGKNINTDGHYVVYQSRTDKKITVLDPQTAESRDIPEDTFIKQWKDTLINGGTFKRFAMILEKTSASKQEVQTQVKEETKPKEVTTEPTLEDVTDIYSPERPVYHGTTKEFDKFDTSIGGRDGMPIGALGTFFTDEKRNAITVAQRKTGESAVNVKKVYLNFQNPKIYTPQKFKSAFTQLVDDIRKYGKMWTEKDTKSGLVEITDNEPAKKFRKELLDAGYDGIIIVGGNEADGIPDNQFVAIKDETIVNAPKMKGYSTKVEFTPQEAEAINTVLDALASGDPDGAQAIYDTFTKEDKLSLPTFKELKKDIETQQIQELEKIQKELKQSVSVDPEDPTVKLLAVADKLMKHFNGPGALFKITGRRRTYKTPEGELHVGGDVTSAFDNLIFTTDLEGFKWNVRALHYKFDRVFTEIRGMMDKGDVDDADYEQFKNRVAEQLAKRPVYTARRRGISESVTKQTIPESTAPSGPTTGTSEVTEKETSFASIGNYAVLKNITEGQGEKRPDMPSYKRIPFPEIVRIAKELTGKAPSVKKNLGKALGRAYPELLDIKLASQIFSDPDVAALVLAHEIGHIQDFLPEGVSRKGNLLGRIASLNNYLKQFLAEFPGGLNDTITAKEKYRLKKEAEKLAEVPVTETQEIVVAEKLPDPEEILKIWTSNTGGIDNPELLAYIQGLSSELKKDIVKAALRSTVPKWVTFKKQIKETVTSGVIRNSPEDIQRLYKKLLEEEIIKRRLLSLKTIRQELQALSAEWRPWDRLKASKHETEYRDKPSELYADAISVLYNDPERLKLSAPEFYRGYFNYLNQKPTVAAIYQEIQDLLTGSTDDVNKARLDDLYKGFEEGAKKRREIFDKEVEKKGLWFKFLTKHITKFHPAYAKLTQLQKEGKITVSEKQKVRMVLEEMAMGRNDVWMDLMNNEKEVMIPLKNAGISENELGAWFTLERNLSDRLGIANPGGLVGKYAQELKDFLEKHFSQSQQEVLKSVVKKFHERTFAIAETMYKEGMIPEKIFKEKIEPYKDSYVTYGVVKYIEKDYVTPYTKTMTGTLEAIENPLVTTMYKRSSMLEAIGVHRGKVAIRDLLKNYFSDEITESQSVMGLKGQKIYREAPGKYGLKLLEEGKWVSYDIDPYFEGMFKRFETKDLHTIVELVGKFNQVFKPTVTTYKLGWALYNNPMRDTQRTFRNLAAISAIEGVPFKPFEYLANWLRSVPEGYLFAKGELSPYAEMAVANKAFSTPFVSHDPTAGEDQALATLYEKYHLLSSGKPLSKAAEIRNKFLTPVMMVLRALEVVGATFESDTKLAGFKYLYKQLGDTKQAAFYTRNYVGTPNYIEGGTLKDTDNNIMVFSNVIAQGMRTDIELISNPKSFGAYMTQVFLQSGMWKILMLVLASGLLGKKFHDMYQKIPEYNKTNYLVFPFYEFPDGKILYWQGPQDDINRLAGAIIWKVGTAIQGELKKPGQLVDVGAGVFPTVTPIFDIIGAWIDYARGFNPYDSYYGRNVLDQQTAQIRGLEGAKQMSLWTLNQMGLGNFATYDPTTDTTTEKVLRFTPVINRIFKFSDYGQQEVANEIQKKDQQNKAIQNKKEADVVKKYAQEYLKSGSDDPTAYTEKMLDELYPGGFQTKDDKNNFKRLVKDFNNTVSGKTETTPYKTIMNLNLTTSKLETLRRYKQEMEVNEFTDLIDRLYEDKVISKEVYREVE